MLEILEDWKHNFRWKDLEFIDEKLDKFLKQYFN
jgi:hypothetical protein